MGLAASQARLLSLTARIHDVEFEAQQLQYAKLKLALLEDDVYKKYEEALDAETLTLPGADGSRIKASFDNLCGSGSINSSLGKNHYIFRDKNDDIILPDEIYNGYLDYVQSSKNNDPYEFAMYMMGIDINDESCSNTVNDMMLDESLSVLTDLKEKIYKQIETLFDYSDTYAENPLSHDDEKYPDAFEQFADNLFDALINDNDNELKEQFSDMDTRVNNKKIKDILKELKTSVREYESMLYKKCGGAKKIFEAQGKGDNFDSSTFNYYVRWGQLIQNEGGVDSYGKILGCTYAGDFGNNLETDADFLNQELLYGYITLDVYYDDGKGGITYVPTSNATDTYVYMEKEEKVDSTKVKKAEAERDRKLKEISRIDKNYDLNLNRLETERTALTTEYDSVKKVIQDNIDRTFKIFS